MLDGDQAHIQTFRVIPALPEPLGPLLEVAHNLWWTWNPEGASLFRRLDRELWRSTHHNPVELLGGVSQEALDRAAQDQSYLHALGHVVAKLRAHREDPRWHQRRGSEFGAADMLVAYFSAEFGLAECLQIYSGGLGGLAGDHLKAASDLGVPLVGVGLLYRCGYFHQYLNADGWQQETYPEIDFANQPVQRVINPSTNEQLLVDVELDGRRVWVGVWRCDVGRVPLYLLDANLPQNDPADRDITRSLYGGDIERRIQQETVLGVAGVRALDALGIEPTVFHMNEGHSAFLALERIRRLRLQHECAFDEACEAASAQHVFTTHTPVPAGIDRFTPDLVSRYLGWMLPDLGLTLEGLLALGRENVFDKEEFFSMAVLALRTSRRCNGVSRLHGRVSREMWSKIWPGVPVDEAPIGHVTNGVHARTWLSPDFTSLFDRYIGSIWLDDPADKDVWKGLLELPADELWRVHERQREDLIAWCRRRIRDQLAHRGAGPEEIEEAAGALDPRACTIGFARRFATYKRGTLLLKDKKRLRALLDDKERPVQFIIAGKAHPADGSGKELIRELVNFAHEGGRASRVVFIEDYDIAVARTLYQGCDLWLNTPRRGLEASGTSGMKAAMNGVINISILDGWWDEAYESAIGFAIGRGESYTDAKAQDGIESRALYDLLERQALPEFYDRNSAGVPRKWVTRMKRCMQAIIPQFNTNRMVAEYSEQYYEPAHRAGVQLAHNSLEGARKLAAQIARWRAHWGSVSIDAIDCPVAATAPIHAKVPVVATVSLGELAPSEVRVQLYWGVATSQGALTNARTIDLAHGADLGGGKHQFKGAFSPDHSGRCGFTTRVVPRDERLAHPFLPGLIHWRREPVAPRPADTSSPAQAKAPAPADA